MMARLMAADILIIVPTYNERDNLAPLVKAVLDTMPAADLLVVDDGSPDGTGQLADELASADPRVTVLHRGSKQGLGTAYLAGFQHGLSRSYEYFVEMDADFSHDPRHLPALVGAARARADLALGSRYVPHGGTINWGLVRRAVSRGGNIYARTVLGVAIQDLTGGFKCFRRRVLESLDLQSVRSEGYSFQIEMTFRALQKGFLVQEVPIVFTDRRVGRSKMSRAIVAEAVWMVWRLRLGL